MNSKKCNHFVAKRLRKQIGQAPARSGRINVEARDVLQSGHIISMDPPETQNPGARFFEDMTIRLVRFPNCHEWAEWVGEPDFNKT